MDLAIILVWTISYGTAIAYGKIAGLPIRKRPVTKQIGLRSAVSTISLWLELATDNHGGSVFLDNFAGHYAASGN